MAHSRILLLCYFLFSALLNGYVVFSAQSIPTTLNLDIPLSAQEDSSRPSQQADEATDSSKKSFAIPAAEIVGFEFLLNEFNRHFASNQEDYVTNIHTVRENIHRGFQFDRDSFRINQLGHPYQGSIYYGLARSSGLNFWESLGYTTAGSLLWEYAGETVPPSTNDQVTTTFGGSFLGEALFRMGQTFWDSRKSSNESAPEIGAGLTSPSSDLNRLAFGNKLKPEDEKQHPAIFSTFELGALSENISDDANDVREDTFVPVANLKMDYGSPGKSGYHYDIPFDYFNFDGGLASRSHDPVDHLHVRGLLYGSKYDEPASLRGIYGLYGGYDYLAPKLFRVATSSLSFGTTNQWWASRNLAIQSTALSGVGFGAGGARNDTEAGGDFHYGAVPQSLIAMRLISNNRVALEISGQDFYIKGSGSDPSGTNNENISQVGASLTFRCYKSNALRLEYVTSQRNAQFITIADRHQRIETIGLYYTYLWDGDLGAVHWNGAY